jgi:glyoxylase-like metal-dependent hydrolase (beta-lactamase superfamily II)
MLSWQHFPTGESGLYRAPVLISGSSEALLVDGGFTYSDGAALAAAILATGKTLTTIYVSQSDPDYYFSLGPIKKAFPSVSVIAASATVSAIKGNIEKKLAVWGPQLKENGPQTLADIVMPKPFDGAELRVEGQPVEIVTIEGLPHRRYLWLASHRAIFGGVLIFSGLHVWTADPQIPDARARAKWIEGLDRMAAREPRIVVPGHMSENAALDAGAIAYTKNYLVAFEEEVRKAVNSEELVATMTKRYPDAGMSIALQIGAKVAKGEMEWH